MFAAGDRGRDPHEIPNRQSANNSLDCAWAHILYWPAIRIIAIDAATMLDMFRRALGLATRLWQFGERWLGRLVDADTSKWAGVK